MPWSSLRDDWIRSASRGSALLSLLLLLAGSCTWVQAGHETRKQVPEAGGERPIRIGIIGDQTLSTDIQVSYAVMQQGVKVLSSQPLDVVLHTGDLVESTLDPSQVTALWKQGTGILDQLPVPWYMTAGDHDVNPPAFQQDSSDRSRERLWQQLYGARVPAVLKHPYYSFDLGGFHFISLYSFGALDSDSRFGNIFLSQIYDDQYDFLENDLAGHRNARAIIVWVHQPLWYHTSGWKRVHELLRRYPVAVVISGHFHYNQDGGAIDGIRYLTVGATGGAKKAGSRQAGDVDHVSVVTVAGPGQVTAKLLALDDLALDLTPRIDMDRVQALDVQLGNFFDFSSKNPVFVDHGGQLINDCAKPSPALIRITQIGNPLDLPLDVSVGFSSNPPGVTLSSPGFSPGTCLRVIGDTECVLPRTARTFVSNYSSVDTNQGSPLWTTGLATHGRPQPGTSLSFDVKTAFQGESGQLFLHKRVVTMVQACP